LDNCANRRAVIHTLHSRANPDPDFFFFFEKHLEKMHVSW
jgi:hypothetical protein